MFTVYGILLLIAASMGANQIWLPLKKIQFPHTPQLITPLKSATQVSDLNTLNAELKAARGQWVMLDFYADWCVSCKVLENTTFQDPNVIAALQSLRIMRADVTANNAEHHALQKHLGVIAPPSFVFFDRQGRQMPDETLVGEFDAKTFLAHVQRLQARQQ